MSKSKLSTVVLGAMAAFGLSAVGSVSNRDMFNLEAKTEPRPKQDKAEAEAALAKAEAKRQRKAQKRKALKNV